MAIEFKLISNAVVNESETASFEVTDITGVPVSGCPIGKTFYEGGTVPNPFDAADFASTGAISTDGDSLFLTGTGSTEIKDASGNTPASVEYVKASYTQTGNFQTWVDIAGASAPLFYLGRISSTQLFLDRDGYTRVFIDSDGGSFFGASNEVEFSIVNGTPTFTFRSSVLNDDKVYTNINHNISSYDQHVMRPIGANATVTEWYSVGTNLPNNCTGEVADATIEYFRNGALAYTGNPWSFVATLGMNGDQIVARVSTDSDFEDSSPVTLVVSGLQTGAKKISHTVKVYAGTTEDESSIGLSGGVCSWGVDNQTLGILTEDWVTGINLSVDMSVSGNYARYSDPKVSIVKSANVETVLNNIDLSLINSRIEIESTDGTNTIILYRGVIKSFSESGNVVVLALSHLSNYYATQLSPNVGDESVPIAWGDSVDGVKLPVVQPPKSDDLTIGDNLIPAFVVNNQDENYLYLRSVYDDTLVTASDILGFAGDNIFSISGENSLVGRGGNSVAYEYVISGVAYWGFRMTLIPLNIKDDTGTPYLPDDSTVILESTDYAKYYIPYGSDITNSTLQYKDGDVFYDFPEYIDSRVDYSDRIEILDADNSGDAYVPPYAYSGVDNANILNGEISSLFEYYGNGVYYRSDAIDITSVTVSNNSEMANRGSDTNLSINIIGVNNDPSLAFDIITSFIYPVRFDRNDIPEDLYATRYLSATASVGSIQYQSVDPSVSIKTITGFTSYLHESTVASGVYSDNLLPRSVSSNDENVKYRWENDHNLLGKDINIFDSSGIEDYEKVAGVTVVPTLTTSVTPGAFDITIEIKCFCVRSVSYNTDQIYLNGVEGRKDDFSDTVIVDTLQAYFSVLELQNYSALGFNIPEEGWGLGFTSSDVLDAIGGNEGYNYAISASIDNTASKDLKIRLLTLMSTIGYIDSQGEEASKRISRMYESGYVFNAFNIEDQPDITGLDPIKTFPLMSVRHGAGTVSVDNIEQDIYSSEYVSGFVTAGSAKEIWRGCKLVYDKYGIKNKLPDKMQDVSWFTDDSVAASYIEDQLERMGVQIDGDIVTLKERYTLKFKTDLTTFFKAVENDMTFWIGSSISFTYPNIASAHTGMITGLSFNPTTGKVSVTAEMVGDLLATSDVATIIESGTQTDDIVESGTQTTNYVEEI